MQNISVYPIARENFKRLGVISKDKSIARFISFGNDLEKVFARTNPDNHVWYGIFVDDILVGDIICELFEDKVYLGIRIVSEYRAQGIGSIALRLMDDEIATLGWQFIAYTACIEKDNFLSLKFFNSLEFHCVGIDKDGYLVFEKANPAVALIPFRERDAEFLLSEWIIQGNMRALREIYRYDTLDKVATLINDWARNTFDGEDFRPFAIYYGGKIVGLIALANVDTVEIIIDERCRHLWVGARAIAALIKIARTLGYTKLTASCDIGAISYKRIFENSGFVCHGASVNIHGMTAYTFEYDIK